MFKRYTLIGHCKSSAVFYDKKLKRAVTFDQFDIKYGEKKDWKVYKYLVWINKYGFKKLIIKISYVVVPLLLILALTFFRETYTTFHLYLFIFIFMLLGLIIPFLIYKFVYWNVKFFVPKMASLTSLNEAFIDSGICSSNVYEKITFKIWVGKIIGPMCYTWFSGLLAFYSFWDKVIHNQIVNTPINRISLICNFAPGLLFGVAILVTFVWNLVGRAILLIKHQRGEIETLPDVEIETIVNKEDSIVEKEVRGEENGK